MHIDYEIIETILNNKKSVLSKDVQNTIITMTKKHADDIINAMVQQKIMFDAYPSLFIGGGAALLKPFIVQNPIISNKTISFINDNRINAKAYANLIRKEFNM